MADPKQYYYDQVHLLKSYAIHFCYKSSVSRQCLHVCPEISSSVNIEIFLNEILYHSIFNSFFKTLNKNKVFKIIVSGKNIIYQLNFLTSPVDIRTGNTTCSILQCRKRVTACYDIFKFILSSYIHSKMMEGFIVFI